MVALATTDWDVHQHALSSELADNTRAAYQKGWSKFVDYCAAHRIVDPLSASPHRVASFFVHLATHPSPQSGAMLSMGTVTLYKSAVNKKYQEAGKPSPTNHPTVRATLKGLARLKGSSSRKVDALREYHIEAMLRVTPDSLIGKRDAAIIAVGFAGALRRSEICDLTVQDVEFLESQENGEGRMVLTIRQSKTDQQGKGQKVPILDGYGIRPINRLRLVAGGFRNNHRPPFPNHEARRQLAREALAPQRHSPYRQALREIDRTRSEGHRRALSEGRLRHQRSGSPCTAG